MTNIDWNQHLCKQFFQKFFESAIKIGCYDTLIG